MKLNVKLTADELMDVVDAAVNEAIDRGYDGIKVDELTEDMTHIVDAALAAMGIEIVEDDDDYEDDDEDWDEDEDEDEDEDKEDDGEEEDEEEDDPIASMIYMIGDTVVIAKSDADTIMEIMQNTINLRASHLSKQKKIELRNQMFIALCKDYGIEGIDEDE